MFTQNTGERQEAELYFCSSGGIMYDLQPRLFFFFFFALSVKKKPTTCWDFITRKRCLKKEVLGGYEAEGGLAALPGAQHQTQPLPLAKGHHAIFHWGQGRGRRELKSRGQCAG